MVFGNRRELSESLYGIGPFHIYAIKHHLLQRVSIGQLQSVGS